MPSRPQPPNAAALLLLPMVGLLFFKLAGFNRLISPGHQNLHEAIVALLAVSGLMVLATVLLPARWRWGLLLGLDGLVSLMVLADTLYLRYFGEVLPMGALAHTGLALDVMGSVGALLRPEDAWLFLDLALLVPLSRWASKPIEWLPSLRPGVRLGATLAAMAVLTGILGTRIADFDRKHPHALSGAWNPRYLAASVGAFPYHGIDAYFTFGTWLTQRIDDRDVEAIAAWFDEKHRTAAPPNKPLAAGTNLVVVQVEALQNFVVGRKIEGRAITPHLNALAARSAHFTNVYGQTRDGNTSDAEFMVNTGLYPAPRGAAFVRYAGNTYAALPEALAPLGYTSVAMHANAPDFWNRRLMYQAMAFDRFYSVRDYALDESIGLGLSDRSFYAQSAAKLATLPQPFYAWMVTLSSHHPFDDAGRHSDLAVGALEGTRLGHYLKSLHYADAQLGAFLDDLERRGLADRTTVVVVGDHPGVQREDEEALFRLVGATARGDDAWRSLQQVPVVIHVPGMAPRRVDLPGGQIDVLPTLAGLYGLSFPVAFGQDLLQAKVGFVVFRDGTYVTTAGHSPSFEERARRHHEYGAKVLTANLVPALRTQLSRYSARLP